MCLYPILIKNRKYTPNKKNGGNVPECKDERTLSVPVGCGKCIECRKQKARQWQVRLHEEIKSDNTGKFVTLSFSEESLYLLSERINSKEANKTAKEAVRLFRKRWEKKFKKSIKHWLIPELGHNNTERLHLHGLLFTTESKETIEKLWNYGNVIS